jgi:Domain of unknown function (DUF4172)
MKRGEKRYIWQARDWPAWRHDLTALATPLTQVSHAQGLLLGRLADVGTLSVIGPAGSPACLAPQSTGRRVTPQARTQRFTLIATGLQKNLSRHQREISL